MAILIPPCSRRESGLHIHSSIGPGDMQSNIRTPLPHLWLAARIRRGMIQQQPPTSPTNGLHQRFSRTIEGTIHIHLRSWGMGTFYRTPWENGSLLWSRAGGIRGVRGVAIRTIGVTS